MFIGSTPENFPLPFSLPFPRSFFSYSQSLPLISKKSKPNSKSTSDLNNQPGFFSTFNPRPSPAFPLTSHPPSHLFLALRRQNSDFCNPCSLPLPILPLLYQTLTIVPLFFSSSASSPFFLFFPIFSLLLHTSSSQPLCLALPCLALRCFALHETQTHKREQKQKQKHRNLR